MGAVNTYRRVAIFEIDISWWKLLDLWQHWIHEFLDILRVWNSLTRQIHLDVFDIRAPQVWAVILFGVCQVYHHSQIEVHWFIMLNHVLGSHPVLLLNHAVVSMVKRHFERHDHHSCSCGDWSAESSELCPFVLQVIYWICADSWQLIIELNDISSFMHFVALISESAPPFCLEIEALVWIWFNMSELARVTVAASLLWLEKPTNLLVIIHFIFN